jgi:hypothetical protein
MSATPVTTQPVSITPLTTTPTMHAMQVQIDQLIIQNQQMQALLNLPATSHANVMPLSSTASLINVGGTNYNPSALGLPATSPTATTSSTPQMGKTLVMSSQYTNLIPPLTSDLSTWAHKVRRVLKMRNVKLDDKSAAEIYVPMIMKALPGYLISAIPDDATIASTLDYLETFDDDGGILENLQADRMLKHKPSTTFLTLVNELLRTVEDMDLRAARITAWANMKVGYPHEIKMQLPSLDIRAFPKERQLKMLDNIYKQYAAKHPDLVPAIASLQVDRPVTYNQSFASDSSSSNAATTSAIDKLVNVVNALQTQVAEQKSAQQQVWNNRAAISNGNNVPRNSNTPNNSYNRQNNYQNNTANSNVNSQNNGQSRKMQFDNRPDKRVCYYHFFFAKLALKCDIDNCPMKHLLKVPQSVAR